MASTITVVSHPRAGAVDHRAGLEAALQVFRTVDASCSRFDAASALATVNARPGRWHRVPPVLFDAVLESHRAFERTRGRFDPRVLRDLVRLGYRATLPFAKGGVVTPPAPVDHRALGPWRPRFRGGPRPQLHLGGAPIDLGGIGKGLAVRWAAERLDPTHDSYLIDAGGDCACRGPGPDGAGWRIGVEDPFGGRDPLAVLELRDTACATSSTRVRTWRSGGRTVHHLIDPRTGTPGGRGLAAVTVVADDPAEAEVLSKVLFLQGRERIAAESARRRVAALWVGVDGAVGESPRIDRHVLWRAA